MLWGAFIDLSRPSEATLILEQLAVFSALFFDQNFHLICW